MEAKSRLRLVLILLVVVAAVSTFIYFKYFFTYEQQNVIKRKIGSITGMNLTITVFGYDGKIVKRWKNIQKITSGKSFDGKGERNYTYFYTKDNKYVQIPDSVWYIAEEE